MAISESLKEKIKLLKEWDDAYYNKSSPVVSDEKYDLVKDYVMRELPPGSPELKHVMAKVGHTVSKGWPKERHVIAMGSQNKISNVQDIKKWCADVMVKLKLVKFPPMVLQNKVDGFSTEVRYKDGSLDCVVSRGDGVVGENFTPNAKKFRHLPHLLSVKKDIIVRAEGFITKANFEALQKLTGNKYKNARNAASGISRRFDGDSSEYVQIIAYDINANVKTESEKIEIIKKLGFKAVPTVYCDTLEKVIEVYQSYKDDLRDKVSYDIDGLVLKLDSVELQERMGVTNNRPDGQVALKFSSDQAITKLDTIVDQVGRTGKLTPVGMLKPVDLMGSTITKATLHNYAYIEEKFISLESEVVIEKKGDIIPQIVDVVTPGKGYKRPNKCPSCSGSLVWDKVNLWCQNEGCREREVNRILYWIQVLDMKGFSSSFVEKLWDTGKIKRISDLYTLNPDSLTSITGLGAKTIKGFFDTLQAKKEMYLEQFIVALGIPGVSKGTASDLVSNFGTWDNILMIRMSDLVKIPGYAEISSETVCDGIQEVSEMAFELLKVIKIKEKKKGTLTGLSFCVTGSLGSMSRKEFEELVVNEGGSFKSSITVGLSYLVTNTPDSGSGKNSKVRVINEKLDKEGTPEKKTRIITEQEFIALAKVEPKKESTKPVGEDTTEVSLDFEPLFI